MLPQSPLILLSMWSIVCFFVFWSKATKWLIVSFVKQRSKEKFYVAVQSVINVANCCPVFLFWSKASKVVIGGLCCWSHCQFYCQCGQLFLSSRAKQQSGWLLFLLSKGAKRSSMLPLSNLLFTWLIACMFFVSEWSQQSGWLFLFAKQKNALEGYIAFVAIDSAAEVANCLCFCLLEQSQQSGCFFFEAKEQGEFLCCCCWFVVDVANCLFFVFVCKQSRQSGWLFLFFKQRNTLEGYIAFAFVTVNSVVRVDDCLHFCLLEWSQWSGCFLGSKGARISSTLPKSNLLYKQLIACLSFVLERCQRSGWLFLFVKQRNALKVYVASVVVDSVVKVADCLFAFFVFWSKAGKVVDWFFKAKEQGEVLYYCSWSCWCSWLLAFLGEVVGFFFSSEGTHWRATSYFFFQSSSSVAPTHWCHCHCLHQPIQQQTTFPNSSFSTLALWGYKSVPEHCCLLWGIIALEQLFHCANPLVPLLLHTATYSTTNCFPQQQLWHFGHVRL